MRKRFSIGRRGALAGAAGIGLTALAPFRIARGAVDAINVATGLAIDHSGVFMAVDRGIFEKHGLDVKVRQYPTGVEQINAMVAGEVIAAFMGTIPLLTSSQRGLPIVLVGQNHGDATISDYSRNQGIVASRRSGIAANEVAKFAGKKVGVPLGTDAEGYFRKALAIAGVPASATEFVNIRPPDAQSAMTQGSIDGFACWEPWVTMNDMAGHPRVRQGGSVGLCLPSTILTSSRTVAQRRSVVKRLLIASAESRQWVRNNLDASAEGATRWITGMQVPVAKSSIRNMLFDPRLSKFVVDGLREKTVPFLADLKIVQPFDAAQAVDPSLIVEVMREHPAFFSDLAPIPQNMTL
jgi:NitT/TauT family transport system substrate-binding protein/sulfonate transport system substrate-binding protein